MTSMRITYRYGSVLLLTNAAFITYWLVEDMPTQHAKLSNKLQPNRILQTGHYDLPDNVSHTYFDSIEQAWGFMETWNVSSLIPIGSIGSQAKVHKIFHINYEEFYSHKPEFISMEDEERFCVNNTALLGVPIPETLKGELWFVSDAYVGFDKCGWKSIIPKYTSIVDRKVYNLYPDIERYSEDSIIAPILVPQGHTFQHFLDGVLPKLMQIYPLLQLPNIKILFGQGFDNPLVWDIVQTLGVKANKVVLMQSPLGIIPNMLNTCVTPPLHPVLWKQAQKLLNIPETHQVSPQKGSVILLTRVGSRNQGRNMINQFDVEDLLTQRYGDQFVTFKGGYTLNESIAMFSQARIVIGVHGGAFYNIHFSPSSTRVVEIMPLTKDGAYKEGIAHSVFWKIADMLGQKYYRLHEIESRCKGNGCDVHIDLLRLNMILDKVDAS